MYLKTNLCQSYFEMQFFTDEAPMTSEAPIYVNHALIIAAFVNPKPLNHVTSFRSIYKCNYLK